MKTVTIQCHGGMVYEGLVLADYQNHIIVEDHEFGVIELSYEDVQEVTTI